MVNFINPKIKKHIKDENLQQFFITLFSIGFQVIRVLFDSNKDNTEQIKAIMKKRGEEFFKHFMKIYEEDDAEF